MSQVSAYTYRAARANGALESGVVEAPSREAARRVLTDRGLFALDIAAEQERRQVKKRLPLDDLALGLRMLATLLGSGLPMTRALAILPELVPTPWELALDSIEAAVREGKGLATALEEAPLSVPQVIVGIIRAGERGSGIAEAVDRAAALAEANATTRSAIRNALAYPLLLAIVSIVAIGLLVEVVLPRFGAILTDLGQTLPASTRFVLDAATLAKTAAIPLLAATVIALAAWSSWVRTESGARRWAEMLLSVPLLGGVRHSSATARASTALSALLMTGVPISTALLHAAAAAGDEAIRARLLQSRSAIATGRGIANAFALTGALTPTAVRLVRAGEESGRVAAMLSHAAALERVRAEQEVRGAVRFIEPALILGFGGVVGLVAAALLQAIYSVHPT